MKKKRYAFPRRGQFYSIRTMSEYCRQDPRACIVGYALNPKKLRKSNSEIGDLTPPTTSCRKQLPCKNDKDSPSLVPLGTDVSVQSQLQLIWRGGGLADIVSGGLTCEGVQFVQWYPEIPANEQPHFDVIIHKLTEDIEKSSDKIRSLEQYLKLNPETIIIDPLVRTYCICIAALSQTIPHMTYDTPTKRTLTECSINLNGFSNLQLRMFIYRIQ